MRIDPCDKEVFAGYMTALRALEKAFNTAGIPVSFYCLNASAFGKTVIIRNGKATTTISIEGDSYAQAVKDVAKAVPL